MKMSQLKSILIFGTDTTNTEEMSGVLCEEFTKQGIAISNHDIINVELSTLLDFELIVLGIPTWDFGGIQEDWEEREDELKSLDLTGKFVALYGLGDQFGYADYFVDAMGWLHKKVIETGATIIGYWPTQGYDFEASRALVAEGELFCGLALDEDQQIELSPQRIKNWVQQLNAEITECGESER